MTRQRALRLAREWAQGHKCTIRDGEVAEYHSMFATILEKGPPNEPLTCNGCIHEHNEHENCNYCLRASYLGDYYYCPLEEERGGNFNE